MSSSQRGALILRIAQLILLVYLFLVSIDLLKEGFQLLGGSPGLYVSDLKDPQALASHLRAADDPLSRHIAQDVLAPQTRQMLQADEDSGGVSPELRDAILADLNPWIETQRIYSDELFARVDLDESLLQRARSETHGEGVPKVNRDLLSAAYPDSIAPMRKSLGARLIRPRAGEGLLQSALAALVGLCIGLLATSLAQSSSSTTSILVSMVAAGTLDISQAVPMVMGANIGTSVTNTLVATGHILRKNEFERAFAAAVVHDAFNVLTVIILLPVEIFTRYLTRSALLLEGLFEDIGGFSFLNPLKDAVAPVAKSLQHLAIWLAPQGSSNIAAAICLVLALAILFVTLKFLTGALKAVMVGPLERLIHGALFKSTWTAIAFGLFVTACVQSSSITTSMIVPLVAGGILTLQQAFPFTVGANIGTTVTALMAALVTQSPAAVALALTHFLFNVTGAAIFLPLRKLPIAVAQFFGRLVLRFRPLAIILILLVFFIFPLAVILLFG